MAAPLATSRARPWIAIACGGTGGHVFPGLAVGVELVARGGAVQLLVSPKDVDQQAVRSAAGLEVTVLPAVGLTRRRVLAFVAGFIRSFLAARRLFARRMPVAVLSTGGFTGAPPVLAGKRCGAVTALHESNTIPGRANRWLARVVDEAFVTFPSTVERLRARKVTVTGTPVRRQFQPADPAACRAALGLGPDRPVLLVMGGSQGARGVNQLVLAALPGLVRAVPELQFLHLTGPAEFEPVRAAYARHQARAEVRPFLQEMELALGAATAAVSRAGGSTLAELAAMRLPAVLIPYPWAADHHQLVNARALADAGAALLLEEREASGEKLAALVLRLVQDPAARAAMSQELVRWHAPRAAAQIAERLLALARQAQPGLWPGGEEEPSAAAAPPGRDARTAAA